MIQHTMKSCQQTDCTLNIVQYTNKTYHSGSIKLEFLTKSLIPWKSVVNWAISFFLILATGTIFFGNLLIILAFITYSHLRRITDQYIVSLAVADLLVAILVLPLAIVRQNLGTWPFESDRLCQFWLSANIVLCMASILNLCCISLDRYIAVTHPMSYFIKRTRLTASAMIAVAWILPLIIMLPPIVGGNQHTLGLGSCHVTYNKAYRIYSSIAGFFGPFLLIAYIYIRVFIIIKRRLKVLNSINIKSHTQNNFKSSVKTIPNPPAIVTNLPGFSLINESKQILHQDHYDRIVENAKIEQKDKHLLSSPKSLTPVYREKCLRLKSLPSLKTEYNKTQLPQKNMIYCRHDQFTFHREQKTTRILAAVVGCFTLCWFPFFICMIGEVMCDCQYSDSLLTFVTWLGYFNSICNPFIYAFFKKEYSKAFKCILRVNKWNIKRKVDK